MNFYSIPVAGEWLTKLDINGKCVHAIGKSKSESFMNMQKDLCQMSSDILWKFCKWRRNSIVKAGRVMSNDVANGLKKIEAVALNIWRMNARERVKQLAALRAAAVDCKPKCECVLWDDVMRLVKWAEYITQQ